ncbi:MAG TPA: hypothetical protein VF525_01795 [Pyrinomonadaceae bacterium]|jgi:hypothetical protein
MRSDEVGGPLSQSQFREGGFSNLAGRERGFMQIDAPSGSNVSRASCQPTAFVYLENTALVDFVAKYFSLSDKRQVNCDERPGRSSAPAHRQLFNSA